MFVNDIEFAYFYDFTSDNPGAVIYLCVKDIECGYLYALTVLGLELSFICVLGISNVSICMILPVLIQEWSCIYALRILNVSICMILPVLSQERYDI